MTRRPTIVDVAQAAGVSKSTVSLVLQGSPLVREETRMNVRAAMSRVGYVYNRAAAQMRRANAGLIGLVINDLRNPFFTEFATSAQMAFSARGYATVVANTDEDPALQAQVVGSMIEHGVAAILISPTWGDEHLTFDAIARAGIPAMQVLRQVDARSDLFPFASHDYALGSRMAADHLIAQGARSVAFVGGPEGRPITCERMSGYLVAMDRIGQPPLTLHGRATRAFGREAARRLRRDHPGVDAALCFNDLVALGMSAGLAEIGCKVGEGFRIVGFDDIEECAEGWPQLTSVRCDIAGFAAHAARTILDWLEGGTVPAPEYRAPVSLVVRASSGGVA